MLPHLRPLDGATPGDETHGLPRLTVRSDSGKTTPGSKSNDHLQPWSDHSCHLLLNSDRASALGDRMDLLQTPVEAVDARLWSRTPTMINIEPTTRCNFNCWYCVGRHMEQADIRVEDFEKMLDNLPPPSEPLHSSARASRCCIGGFLEMAAMASSRNTRHRHFQRLGL